MNKNDFLEMLSSITASNSELFSILGQVTKIDVFIMGYVNEWTTKVENGIPIIIQINEFNRINKAVDDLTAERDKLLNYLKDNNESDEGLVNILKLYESQLTKQIKHYSDLMSMIPNRAYIIGK